MSKLYEWASGSPTYKHWLQDQHGIHYTDDVLEAADRAVLAVEERYAKRHGRPPSPNDWPGIEADALIEMNRTRGKK